MRLRFVALLLLFTCSLFCVADEVSLANGDHLTGTVVKSDGKTLVLKTDFAGDVAIQWSSIQSFKTSEPVNVVTKDGKTIAGPVTTTDGSLAVASTREGTVSIPKDNVTALRSDAEQAAYEKTLHPRLTQGWAGGANIGFSLTRGNSETKNLALAFNADRKTLRDDLTLYTNSVYATNDAPGAIPGTTANTIQAGIRYARDIRKRIFGYGTADFQTDALQSLDLRSVVGGGLGFHAIKTDRTTLDFLGGLDYTRENYSSFTRNFAALSIGQEFSQKVGKGTLLIEKAYYFPDLSQTSEYRATFNAGTVTKLSKWLGWQNAFGEIYVTNPPVGAKKNDILLTTGLNVSFTH